MSKVIRTVEVVKAILMRSEVEEGILQLLECLHIPANKAHEMRRATEREYDRYKDHPDFNGHSLVIKGMIVDGVFTLRSTPILAAYKDSKAPSLWETFYTAENVPRDATTIEHADRRAW